MIDGTNATCSETGSVDVPTCPQFLHHRLLSWLEKDTSRHGLGHPMDNETFMATVAVNPGRLRCFENLSRRCWGGDAKAGANDILFFQCDDDDDDDDDDFNGRQSDKIGKVILRRRWQLGGARILCDLAEILQGCHSHRACH